MLSVIDASPLVDAKRRLAWVLSEAHNNRMSESPFWAKIAAAAWSSKPLLNKTDVRGLYIVALMNGTEIGTLQFSPDSKLVGLKLYSQKGEVLVCFGSMSNDFTEEDVWAPLTRNFGDLPECPRLG